MVMSFVISYSLVPAGTFTSTVSPSSWLRRHLPLRDLVEVDHGERGQPPVDLADARLEEALALLGRLVLGVLPQVAVLPRLQDLLGKVDLQLVVQDADLFFELLLDVDHP